MNDIISYENAVSECHSAELRKSVSKLAAIHFVPRCVNRQGGRKLIVYDRRFESAYQSPKLPAYLKEKILSTLLTLFIEPYSSEKKQKSSRTHSFDSTNLRREGWIRDLRDNARVSRVNDEWRIVWSEDPSKVTVHAVCRHQDIYSQE